MKPSKPKENTASTASRKRPAKQAQRDVLIIETPKVLGRFISTQEACQYGGFSLRLLFKLVREQHIVAKKLGARTLVDRLSIDKMLERLPGATP